MRKGLDLVGGDLAGRVVAALVENVFAAGVLDPDGAGAGGDVDAADVVVVDIVHADGEAVVEQRVEPVDEAVCVRWFDERVVVVETDRFAVVGNADQQCPAVVVEHSCDSLRHRPVPSRGPCVALARSSGGVCLEPCERWKAEEPD